jgi:hypothetical protein
MVDLNGGFVDKYTIIGSKFQANNNHIEICKLGFCLAFLEATGKIRSDESLHDVG